MASTVYDEVEILLQDNTEVTLKPLPIVQLRRFMTAWKEMSALKGETDEEKEEYSYTVLINCAGIALEYQFKALEKFNETKGKLKDPLSKEYRDYLESVLDEKTIYKVLEVCGGLRLNDPNLIAALSQEAQE